MVGQLDLEEGEMGKVDVEMVGQLELEEGEMGKVEVEMVCW